MVYKRIFDKYFRKEKNYFGFKPNKGVIKILKFKKSGTVLDLGVGQGKNALFLAKRGFDVTGVDNSQVAINNFLESAKNINVKVKGLVGDITKIKFNKNYDVIISNVTLHFLEKEKINDVIKNIKKHTNKGGINLITVFTVENPSKNFPYLFQKNELKNFYKDWKILEYKEYLTPFEKHGEDGKLHRHAIAAIITRKV